MRLKALTIAVGLGLLAVSLLGAARMLDGDNKTDPAPTANTASNGGSGVTVLGVVHSEAGEIPLGPPTVSAVLAVQRILVDEGKSVAVDEPLVQFDDMLFRHKIAQAKAECAAAQEDLFKANAAKAIHVFTLAGAQLALETSEHDLKEAREALVIGKDQFERVLASQRDITPGKPYTEADKAQARRDNLELRKAEVMIVNLAAKAQGDRLKLEALKLTPIDADVRAATAKIERLNATVAEAEAAVNACVLRAKVPGVVEQIHAAPGQVFGPASRTPVLWLIPAGKRIIRAEVEPEFASRIADKEGRKVTITDGSNFTLHYDGIIRRVGTSFLPKRSQLDTLLTTSTKALECVIDVADPAPAGKPPLRVGQPVRVLIP